MTPSSSKLQAHQVVAKSLTLPSCSQAWVQRVRLVMSNGITQVMHRSCTVLPA